MGSSPIGTAMLRSSNGSGQLTFYQQIRVPCPSGQAGIPVRSANGVFSLTGLALLKLREGAAKCLAMNEENRIHPDSYRDEDTQTG